MKKSLVLILQLLVVSVTALAFQHTLSHAQSARTPTVESRLSKLEESVALLKLDVESLRATNTELVKQVNLVSLSLGLTDTLTRETDVQGSIVGDSVPTAHGDEDVPSDIKIHSVDGKVVEANDVWWKMAWVLEIENIGTSTINLTAKIEFLDAEGFVLDDDYDYGIRVKPGETVTANGYALVDASVAPNVDSISAEVFE